MFGLKKHKDFHETASMVYAAALSRARSPQFYTENGVPDSFDGRFEMLVLHVFMVMHKMTAGGAQGQEFNQSLFDVMFADMDQTLREMGIGDMGIPKHMKRMMKGFNGRIHTYRECVETDGAISEDVLARNLYGTVERPSPAHLRQMKDYIAACLARLDKAEISDISSGHVEFAALPAA